MWRLRRVVCVHGMWYEHGVCACGAAVVLRQIYISLVCVYIIGLCVHYKSAVPRSKELMRHGCPSSEVSDSVRVRVDRRLFGSSSRSRSTDLYCSY